MQQLLVRWILFSLLLFGQPAVSLVQAQGPRATEGGVTNRAAAASFAAQVKKDQVNWSALVKIISLVLLILVWVKSGEWVNYDSQIFGLSYRKWNAIIFFPFAALLLGSFFFPVPFVARFPLLAVIWLATLLPYVVVHNKNVEPHQTVLTGAWLRYSFAQLANKLGIKVSAERKAAYEKGAAIDLLPMGGKDTSEDNANLLTARQSPGYVVLKNVLAEVIGRRAERVLLDYTQQAVNTRYEVDGVWHSAEMRDRESSDVMLAVIKTLSNLDIKERRRKQSGQFGAKFEGETYLCSIVSQGAKAGERVVLTLQRGKPDLESYEALGMREDIQRRWSDFMFQDKGLVILSTLPGGGLTTITDVSLMETDRLMRDFCAIEEANHRNREVQNVAVNTYDASAGQTPDTILPNLIRTYPNVYVVRDFVNRETAKLLFDEIRDEHLVITTTRSRDAAEALLRMLQMKVPSKDFAAIVTAVLHQRLVRVLCPNCKVSYLPSPEVLRKLGIPVGKIEKLYRPPKPEEIEKPCPTCRGLAYKGRTGIFELLEVTDQMREILVKQPKLELLRKAAKAARHRSLQEEGILLVAKGATSLPELMRVLKQ